MRYYSTEADINARIVIATLTIRRERDRYQQAPCPQGKALEIKGVESKPVSELCYAIARYGLHVYSDIDRVDNESRVSLLVSNTGVTDEIAKKIDNYIYQYRGMRKEMRPTPDCLREILLAQCVNGVFD